MKKLLIALSVLFCLTFFIVSCNKTEVNINVPNTSKNATDGGLGSDTGTNQGTFESTESFEEHTVTADPTESTEPGATDPATTEPSAPSIPEWKTTESDGKGGNWSNITPF